MSNLHLMKWFEDILFGVEEKDIADEPPPPQLKSILFRMEAESIPWTHIMKRGGFTSFPYRVIGDLNILIDHLEKEWIEKYPPFDFEALQTRPVYRFWKELQILLARRESTSSSVLSPPLQDDDTLLKHLLSNKQPPSLSYQSASFWGDVARRFMNLGRSMTEELSPMPKASSHHLKRAMVLYDMTCQSRGEYLDPFNMVILPSADYVNAVHWQSDSLLEAFMHTKPDHPLTQSIQNLLYSTLNHVLHGQKPTALSKPFPELDALLQNIQVVHTSVQQVPHSNQPPLLTDVFQRLLALSRHDYLWEGQHSPPPPPPPTHEMTGTELFLLTEQLHKAERHNQFLLQQKKNVLM